MRDTPDELIPPPEMDFVGGGDFKAIGRALVEKLVAFGGLEPQHHVLDVGCGIGRVAAALTQYLDERGRYEGFDIVKMGVDWCNERIAPRYPNFRFRLVDVANSEYNPAGGGAAGDFRFPYPDGAFDFVLLTSVFTHMQRAPMENYFREIARVLKVGGRCFLTFFLLNDESRALIRAGKSTFQFGVACDDVSAVESRENPDAVVGFDERYVREQFRARGLRLDEPPRYGTWCGRSAEEYQDVLIATKQARARDLLQPLRSVLQRVAGRSADV